MEPTKCANTLLRHIYSFLFDFFVCFLFENFVSSNYDGEIEKETGEIRIMGQIKTGQCGTSPLARAGSSGRARGCHGVRVVAAWRPGIGATASWPREGGRGQGPSTIFANKQKRPCSQLGKKTNGKNMSEIYKKNTPQQPGCN